MLHLTDRTLRTLQLTRDMIEDHLKILEAIRNKRPLEGEQVMERHLTRYIIDEKIVKKNIRNILKLEE